MVKAKKNYREMPDDELRKEFDNLVKGLFNLRVRKVTDVVENPAAFRMHRRQVARIKTELRARELKLAAAKKAKPAPAKPVEPADATRTKPPAGK